MRTGFADIVSSSSSSENDTVYNVLIGWNLLRMTYLLNISSSSFFVSFFAWVEFIFTIFVCPLYRLSATDTKYAMFVSADTNLLKTVWPLVAILKFVQWEEHVHMYAVSCRESFYHVILFWTQIRNLHSCVWSIHPDTTVLVDWA